MQQKKLGGYLETFSSYLLWGILPIYWKQLKSLGALDILAVRVIMSAITLAVFLYFTKNLKLIPYIKDKKIRKQLLLTAVLIALNWGIFVYAVNAGHMLEASLGYYMNPLVSVFLGIFVLKEKLTKSQYISIGFAFIGVLYMTVRYGRFPWIAIALAVSFGFYGLFKKTYQLDSMNSLLTETTFLAPFMLIAMMFEANPGQWIIHISLMEGILAVLSGIITVVPLVLFSEGAKRIPLSAVGFLQYVAPTMMLMIGVLMYGEVFKMDHVISFGFIWFGLIVYTVSIFHNNSKKTVLTPDV